MARRRFDGRGVWALLAALVVVLLVPAAGSAQTTSNLPTNEDVVTAIKHYVSGSYTPGEAKVTAQTMYLQQREAGASDEVATAWANEQVPPAEYAGTEGGLGDFWAAVGSADATGSEALATGGGAA